MALFTEKYLDKAQAMVKAETGQDGQVPPGGVEVCMGLFFVSSPKPCCICKRMTPFIEINYEAYLCSEECEHEMDVRAAETAP